MIFVFPFGKCRDLEVHLGLNAHCVCGSPKMSSDVRLSL